MATGLLVFLAYLHFFVGFEEILGILQQVSPAQYLLYYSLTIVAIVLSAFFYSMVWHDLLKTLSINIGRKRSFLYCWIGNFVDLVIPFETVTGEITRIYLITKDLNADLGRTVASVVCHRIISVFTTLSLLAASSLYLVLTYKVEVQVLYLLVAVIIGAAATIAIIFYLSVAEAAAKKLVDVLVWFAGVITRNRLDLAETRNKAEQALSVFHHGVMTFGRNPLYLVKPLVYSYLSWAFHLIVYFLVFYALGFLEVAGRVPQMIIVFSISLSVQTIPIGFPVGLVEIVMTSLYRLFGFGAAISGVATSLIRLVTFWFQILVGYVLVQWVGIRYLLDRNSTGKVGI